MAGRKRLERHITSDVVKLLKSIPHSFVCKVHGGRMQASGLLDVFFTCRALAGRAVWIELKQEGKEMTKIQSHTAGCMEDAGCATLVARSRADVERWLAQQGVPLP